MLRKTLIACALATCGLSSAYAMSVEVYGLVDYGFSLSNTSGNAENAIHNLTRIVSPEEFAIKHVADSLALVRSFPELATAAPEVADIGCGAGS